MTDAELEAVEKACAGATPGPWKLWAMEVRADPVGDSNLDTSIPVAQTYQLIDGRPRTGDADFIANARQWVPALVAEVRRLRAVVDDYDTRWQSSREAALEHAYRAVWGLQCDTEACGHKACIALDEAAKSIRALKEKP